MSAHKVLLVAALGTLALGAIGCDSPVQTTPERAGSEHGNAGRAGAGPRNNVAGAGASGGAGAGANPNAGDGGTDNRPPPLPLNDSDFLESDRTRDPFRNFAEEFVQHGTEPPVDQAFIKLRQYALDELHLVAVVLGTDNPYAMVIDPSGRGTIIRRGDRVGRPDTVAAGPEGMLAHQVPWRVARIVGSAVVRRAQDNTLDEEPGRVIFEREDRLNPLNRAEHVLTLAPVDGPAAAANAVAAQNGAPSIPGLPPGVGTQALPLPPGVTPGAGPNGQTYVQTYTTVVPPGPAPQPATVVIQTGPHGETTVSPPQSQGGSMQPQGPRDPLGLPAGGSNQPPPVQINSGPTFPQPSLPTSGLPRQ